MHAVYDTALEIAAPFARAFLALHKRNRPLRARFHPEVPAGIGRPIWVHACSVGEVNVAAPFLHALIQRWPDIPVLLTVSTVSGRARAEDILPEGAALTWFPFDQRRVVARFFGALEPRALILIETELWPNVLRTAASRMVPVAIVNGRISDRHHARYRRAARMFHPLLESIHLAAMQSEEYARRIVELGARPGATHVTGNLKFDGVECPASSIVAALRQEMGIVSDAPVVVFGSTRPGDETLARRCWDALQAAVPELVLVLAPRHLNRLSDALAPFDDLPVLRRSEVQSGRKSAGERIVVLDTMGELAACYGLADVAVIGGSFSDSVQGHNPIEPAAQAVPVVFGPHMRNFSDAAEMLTSRGGAVQTTADQLPRALRTLLVDPGQRKAIGVKAKEAVASQSGATSRTLALVAQMLSRARGTD